MKEVRDLTDLMIHDVADSVSREGLFKKSRCGPLRGLPTARMARNLLSLSRLSLSLSLALSLSLSVC